MTNIASGDQEIVNSLIGNNNGKINSKFITFYKTSDGLGLLISKAQAGAYVAIANDGSIKPDLKFPSSSWVAKRSCHDQTLTNEFSIFDYPSNFEGSSLAHMQY